MPSRWVKVEDVVEWCRLFDARILCAKPGSLVHTDEWYDMYFPDIRPVWLKDVMGLLVEDDDA